MNNKTGRILLGAAIAGMIGSGTGMVNTTVAMAKSNKGEVPCYGVNDCKSQGACKTASNECKGKNSCKGKGMLKLSKAACEEKGGTTEMPKADES